MIAATYLLDIACSLTSVFSLQGCDEKFLFVHGTLKESLGVMPTYQCAIQSYECARKMGTLAIFRPRISPPPVFSWFRRRARPWHKTTIPWPGGERSRQFRPLPCS